MTDSSHMPKGAQDLGHLAGGDVRHPVPGLQPVRDVRRRPGHQRAGGVPDVPLALDQRP